MPSFKVPNPGEITKFKCPINFNTSPMQLMTFEIVRLNFPVDVSAPIFLSRLREIHILSSRHIAPGERGASYVCLSTAKVLPTAARKIQSLIMDNRTAGEFTTCYTKRKDNWKIDWLACMENRSSHGWKRKYTGTTTDISTPNLTFVMLWLSITKQYAGSVVWLLWGRWTIDL